METNKYPYRIGLRDLDVSLYNRTLGLRSISIYNRTWRVTGILIEEDLDACESVDIGKL